MSLTPERFKELAQFNDSTTGLRNHHGNELLAEVEVLTEERDAARAWARHRDAQREELQARLDRVRAMLIPNMYTRTEANRLLNRIREALDGEATE